MTVLEARDVYAGYGDLMVLHGVNLTVEDGGRVAVLGPNGAGKTTLMRTLAGVLPVASGEIRLAGSDVTRFKSDRRLRQIGWVPEGRQLFGDFTVYDNLALSARAAGRTTGFESALDECLQIFPVLRGKLRARASTLSGGQQQVAAFARALVRHPRLLMLDEPSIGLAPAIVQDIREALERLSARGLTILVSEQNVGWLAGLVESVVIMGGGHVTMQGSQDLLEDRDALRSVYLGV